VADLPSEGTPVLTKSRQFEALAKARASLDDVRDGLARGNPPDLVAVDVQAALDYIGGVTGGITTDDVLDAIFSEFCIGK
jgi:tRNA modification GTPase